MTRMHEGPHAKRKGRIDRPSFSFFLFALAFFPFGFFLLERPGQSVCVRLMGNARTHATRARTYIHTQAMIQE